MVTIQILLDGSHRKIFYPGQEVRGNIRVENKDEIKMRGIRLEVHGCASVVWTEGSGMRENDYYGHENYIELITYVTGSNKKDSELFLKPGVHTFPLNFVLPNTLPPSFEGMHGSIRYWVQADIDRPWKSEVSTRILIAVVRRLLDLNREPPQLREPIVVKEDKPMVGSCYHWSCIKGLPEIELRINRGCFVPGEVIAVKGQLVNNSNTNISTTTIMFMEEIQFCATTSGQIYKRKHEYKILDARQRPEIESGRTDTWSNVNFTVPSTAASRLDGCSIISIAYYIVVRADFSTGCADSTIRQEVLIGHIPLQRVSQLGGPITTQPSAYTAPPPFQPGPQLPEPLNHSGVHGPGWNQGYSHSTESVDHS